MKATLVLHNPPAVGDEPGKATAEVERIAERVQKILKADKYRVRSGSGFNFEVSFS